MSHSRIARHRISVATGAHAQRMSGTFFVVGVSSSAFSRMMRAMASENTTHRLGRTACATCASSAV